MFFQRIELEMSLFCAAHALALAARPLESGRLAYPLLFTDCTEFLPLVKGNCLSLLAWRYRVWWKKFKDSTSSFEQRGVATISQVWLWPESHDESYQDVAMKEVFDYPSRVKKEGLSDSACKCGSQSRREVSREIPCTLFDIFDTRTSALGDHVLWIKRSLYVPCVPRFDFHWCCFMWCSDKAGKGLEMVAFQLYSLSADSGLLKVNFGST